MIYICMCMCMYMCFTNPYALHIIQMVLNPYQKLSLSELPRDRIRDDNQAHCGVELLGVQHLTLGK